MERLLPAPYLDKSGLEALKNYGYHSGGCTVLDNFMNKYWWTPLSQYVPKWIHPNVLTVGGLFASIILSFLPLMYYVPQADSTGPAWIYIVSALGFFLYQTLDALDGKQARRSGLSSPIGQLMDHGCDSLTTFYSVFMIQTATQIGYSPLGTLAATTMVVQLYYYSWYEYTYGIFRSCTGNYTGVTEGQDFIILILLVNTVCPWIWHSTMDQLIPGRIGQWLGHALGGAPFNAVMFVLCTSVMFSVNLRDFIDVVTKRIPPNVDEAIKEWTLIGLHLYCNSALAISGAMQRHPYATTTMIAFYGALLSWKLILSSVAKAKLRLIQVPALPFYATSLLVSCGTLVRVQALETFVVSVTAIWGIWALLSFGYVNMFCIRDYLGFPLFIVPADKRNAPPSENTPVKAAVKAGAEGDQSTPSSPSTGAKKDL